jgi:hypothetical protein
MRAALLVAAVLGAAVSANGAGVRGSGDASGVSLPQFRLAQQEQVQVSIKELELLSTESAQLLQEAKALQGQLSAAPDGVAMDFWACFGKCSAREQLLCASFATIPWPFNPSKAAACRALIATKCGLECQ